MIVAAYGYWLVVVTGGTVAHRVGGGAVLMTVAALLFFDMIDLFERRGPGRTATRPRRTGQPNQGQLRQP